MAGKLSRQLNGLGWSSIDKAADLLHVFDTSADELKTYAADELIKRTLGGGSVSWMPATFTAASSIVSGDLFLVWDASATQWVPVARSVIMDSLLSTGTLAGISTITGTGLDRSNDLALVWDASASAFKKVTLTTIMDREGAVNLSDYVTDWTGATDMTSQVVAAEAAAYASGSGLVARYGSVLLTAATQLRVPLIAPSFGRNSLSRFRFITSVNSGSKTLYIDNQDGVVVENVSVTGLGATLDPATALNTTAFAFGVPGSTPPSSYDASRSYFRNLLAYGVEMGFQIQGWLSRADNLHAASCGIGLKGSYLNNCVMDLVAEECEKGFELSNCEGVNFTRIEEEGAYKSAASTIDNSYEVSIDFLRFEQTIGAAVPWMQVGRTSSANLVRGLRVKAGSLTAPAVGTEPIELDHVEDWAIDMRFASGNNRRYIKTTGNTKYARPMAPRIDYGFPRASSAQGSRTYAENLFPNRFMEGIRFGCKNVTKLASTGAVALTEETALVRTGKSALKLASATAGTYQGVMLTLDDEFVPALANQLITVAGWVYIPNIATMSAEGSQTIFPAIGFASYDGSTEASLNVSPAYVLSNGWAFLYATGTMQASPTELRIKAYVNQSGNNTATTEYIVIDELVVAVGDCWRDIYEGRVTDSAMNPGRFGGGRMTARKSRAQATTMIADTDQTYKAGDVVVFTDAASAGTPGMTCVTGGAGGTAQWSTWAASAAQSATPAL